MAEVITVAALNAYVRSVLEGDPVLLDIAIRGEISNFTRHFKTGHCYFTLKDERAAVKAVMFKSEAEYLSFTPENGMCVVARCRVSLYERDGAFQLYVDALFPDGAGAAQAEFEALKKKLDDEGMFAPEHKKGLPMYPRFVGLVTSKTGAALQDILKVATWRCPTARFLLAPVSVQGASAAPQIAAAIRTLDQDERVDTIVVARGGGSTEDLWVFNSEVIARAAFAAKTPLVSAIGHEIDFTILDFVSDLRAPTPSAAAEAVLPDMREKWRAMMNVYTNIANIMHQQLDSWYNILQTSCSLPVLTGMGLRLIEKQKKLAAISAQLKAAAHQTQQAAGTGLQSCIQLADGLNPYAVLARGYGIVRHQQRTLRSVREITQGQNVEVEMSDGILGCTVRSIEEKAPISLKQE